MTKREYQAYLRGVMEMCGADCIDLLEIAASAEEDGCLDEARDLRALAEVNANIALDASREIRLTDRVVAFVGHA